MESAQFRLSANGKPQVMSYDDSVPSITLTSGEVVKADVIAAVDGKYNDSPMNRSLIMII